MRLNAEDFEVNHPATTLDLKYEKKGKTKFEQIHERQPTTTVSQKQAEYISMELKYKTLNRPFKIVLASFLA